MKNTLQKTAISLAIIASLGLSGCMDDESSPSTALETTSLNKTTTGVITGFGSVFINGVEYDTTNSTGIMDGVATEGGDAGLKLGMVVTVSGDANGTNGTALSIQFNDEVEGMVTEVPVTDSNGVTTGLLKVMGITINMDEDTVFESSAAGVVTAADLALDHIVEVSGYSAGDGTVWATRIELKKEAREAGDKVEVQGMVTNYDAATNTFTIGDMTMSLSADMLVSLADDGIELANDMLIDAKSDVALNADGSLNVTEIDVKSMEKGKKKFEFDADDEEIEVEGVITAAVDTGTSAFDVNGSTVNFDTNTRFVHGTEAIIAIGLKIKVKGTIDANGDFLAQTILFKPTGDIKMSGPVASIDTTNNIVTMFGLTVNLVNNTFVEDDRDDDDATMSERQRVKYLFGADDLVVGDWLKVKAYKNSNGELVATKMKRKTKDSGELAKLQGKVSALSPNVVSGVTVDLTNSGLAPAVGDRIELEGTYDETTSIFTATNGEAANMEGSYIGGEDAEENREDERRHTETDAESHDDKSHNDKSHDDMPDMSDMTSS